MPYICVRESCEHSDSGSSPIQRHYLNQWVLIVNLVLRNNLHWNFSQNSTIFIQENTFEMSSAKWRTFCPGGACKMSRLPKLSSRFLKFSGTRPHDYALIALLVWNIDGLRVAFYIICAFLYYFGCFSREYSLSSLQIHMSYGIWYYFRVLFINTHPIPTMQCAVNIKM